MFKGPSRGHRFDGTKPDRPTPGFGHEDTLCFEVVGANGQRLTPLLDPQVRITPMTFGLVGDLLKV